MPPLTPTARRALFWALPIVLVATFLVLALRPAPQPVDVAPVERGPMTVTVDDEGETRVHDVFTVSAPIAGTLLRTPLHVGDSVDAGATIVARIEPTDPVLLDPRARAEAEHAVHAAEAAARLARADRDRAAAEKEFADAAVRRTRELRDKGAVSMQAIDDAERAARSATASLAAADATIKVRDHELARARAALITPTHADGSLGSCECVDLRAPVSGRVLRIPEMSQTVVQPGEALIDIGDPTKMEIVADYLSNEAATIRPGQRAIIENWGGPPLNATVRWVEPTAFTKVSALGIEEQRANVILDLTDPPSAWPTLGHAYRVDVRVVTWEADAATQVPLTALFRHDDGWAVFVDADGRARLRAVTIGHRAGLSVEVVAGVEPGERVVVNPNQHVDDGARIRAR
jgi:HlyD family secretion protein